MVLYGRVANFAADIEGLVKFYQEIVRPTPCVHRGEKGLVYDGWAITSRDGSIDDSVRQWRRIDRRLPSFRTATKFDFRSLCREGGRVFQEFEDFSATLAAESP
jgi:hypothetical protein